MGNKYDGVRRDGPTYQARGGNPTAEKDPSGFRTAREASDYRIAQLEAIRVGEWVLPDAGAVTFGEWWGRWATQRVVAPTTADRDNRVNRLYLGPLARVPLEAIDRPMVKNTLIDLGGRELAFGTVDKRALLSPRCSTTPSRRVGFVPTRQRGCVPPM